MRTGNVGAFLPSTPRGLLQGCGAAGLLTLTLKGEAFTFNASADHSRIQEPHGISSRHGKNGLVAETRPNGRVGVGLIKDGQYLGEIEISGPEVAEMAARLLNAARESQEQSGLPLPVGSNAPESWATIPVSGLALGPAGPGYASLMLLFGQAVMAVAFEVGGLRNMGQTMIALSANTPPQ